MLPGLSQALAQILQRSEYGAFITSGSDSGCCLMAGQAFFSSSSGITTPVLASKEEAESGAHRNFQEVEKSSFGGQGEVK